MQLLLQNLSLVDCGTQSLSSSHDDDDDDDDD